MNRLKVTLYAVLVLAAVGLAVYQGISSLTDRALAHLDQDLRAAAAQADARAQLLAAEAAQLSGAIGRDPAVVQALTAGSEAEALAAARPAVAAAEASAPERARPLLLAVALRGEASFIVAGAPATVEKAASALLAEAAAEGARREGHVLAGDALYYLVALPVVRGASLAVGVPLGPAYLSQLRVSTGADATVLVDERPVRTTLPPDQALLVARAAGRAGGKVVDAGRLAAVASPQGAPWPELPALLVRAPAYRLEAVALKGLSAGFLALSLPTRGALEPVVTIEWIFLLVWAGLLLAGLLTVLLVVNEQKAVVPRQLLATADRIARGDFAARAEVLAGSLGTIAAALNRAAEAAEQPAPPAPADVFAGELAAAPDPLVAPSPADFLAPPPEPPRPVVPDSDLATGAWVGALREAAVPAAAPAPPAEGTDAGPWAANAPAEEPAPAPPPEAAPEPAPAEPPAEEGAVELAASDEEHWRVVYQEFITARKGSGESVEGVTYERFRLKLKENRDQLVAKYACKTARFQVYLKQGRAALKASPVR